MPIDQKRGTALLIGAAIGIVAYGGNVRADENRAGPFLKMAQAQQQEEEQGEERRRRRRGNDEQTQQGGGEQPQGEERRGRRRGNDEGNQQGGRENRGQANQQTEEPRRRRGGDDDRQRGGDDQRRERRDQAEGQRRQREERREQAEEQRNQARERRNEERQDLRERVRERIEEQRENNRERRDERQERREERRENTRERQDDRQDRRREERRENRRDEARDNRGERLENRRREIEERRRERAERRRDNREEIRERRQERNEFSRRRLKDISRERRETREGGRIILEEPGGRRILRENGRAIIRHDELDRFRDAGRDFREERTRRGHNRRIVTRPNGVQIITVVDEDGRLIRRVKRLPNGRRVVLFNNEHREGHRRRGRGRDRDGFSFYIDLSPPRVSIPRDEYYLYADRASEEDIYDALSAPPVEELEDRYTLDEVLYNRSVRNRMRTVNLNTINFEFGSWEIGEGQIDRLADVADAILSIVEKNPSEVILVAGYTDAVGSDEDNLSLSDRRAETVARVLTDEFSVPPENLVTQGYGEQDLLVDTQSAEVQNRRVEFQRVTPLLAQDDAAED